MLPRDVGSVRMRVVIVMRHIRYWNKPRSALIHLTVQVLKEMLGSYPVFVWMAL